MIDIPNGWDYMNWQVDFSNVSMDCLQDEEEGYIKDNNQEILKVYNSSTYSGNRHRARLGDISLVEIKDGNLKLRSATNSNKFPVPDDSRFGGSVATGIHYGKHEGIIHSFEPPVRIEIKFRPRWVPGNVLAIWMIAKNWVRSPDGSFFMKEFDLIEAGGQFDEGDEPYGKHEVRSAVHSWQSETNNGGHKSSSIHNKNIVDFGSAGTWNTAVFEWLTGSDDKDKFIRYYINDKLLLDVSPSDFNSSEEKKEPISSNYTWAESISNVWNQPMYLILAHHIQPSNMYLGYDNVDPDDFPVDIDFKWIHSYKKNENK